MRGPVFLSPPQSCRLRTKKCDAFVEIVIQFLKTDSDPKLIFYPGSISVKLTFICYCYIKCCILVEFCIFNSNHSNAFILAHYSVSQSQYRGGQVH